MAGALAVTARRGAAEGAGVGALTASRTPGAPGERGVVLRAVPQPGVRPRRGRVRSVIAQRGLLGTEAIASGVVKLPRRLSGQ